MQCCLKYALLPLSTMHHKSAVYLKPEKRVHAREEEGMKAGGEEKVADKSEEMSGMIC